MPDTPQQRVLITGASSGIGAEFAERFAAAGWDLVLVARRRDRLDAQARSLMNSWGVAVAVIDRDLAVPGAAAAIADELHIRGIRVDGLVNSAGFGTAGPFHGEDLQRITDEIQVNVSALTALTRLFLPQLLASPTGVLINVSSNAAYQPLPNLAVYAATKAFVTSLTESIWQETRQFPLRVLALAPGPTATEFFAVAGSDQFKVGAVVTAQRVVEEAFAALGDTQGPPSHIVGFSNRVTAIAARMAPRRLALAVASRLTAAPASAASPTAAPTTAVPPTASPAPQASPAPHRPDTPRSHPRADRD